MRPYPVISSIQAGALKEISAPYSPGDGFDVEYGDDDASPWSFFLEIEGDSMLPDFRPGDRVLIDPEVTPRPGDFVAARNTKQEATFKKYRVRGLDASGNEVFELVPLNDDYPTLRSDEQHLVVIGTMIEHRRKFRRK
ncbi:LexA family protein [Comamonas kerstersii]|uniref:LexA family protein n=1 Tax=Comamonas kerstersii TaxID=225992 RepID=UPI0026DD1BD2|nr:S24 family peptidase [Comamonas kerstersii]